MNSRTRVLLLVTGFAAFVLLGLAQAIFGPVLPVFATAFDLQISTVGWVLSVFWAGSLLAVAAVYAFPATLGPRSGLVSSAAGTALIALMTSWSSVLAGAALFGFGYGVIAAVYNPRVLAGFGPRGPALMSLMNALFTVGAIAAPQVFLALNQNAAAVFWVFTAFAAIVATATLAMGDTRATQTRAKQALRIDWPILGFAFLGIGMESTMVGLGPTALTLAGLSTQDAAQLLSQFFVVYLVARLSLVVIAHLVPPFVVFSAAIALLSALGFAALVGNPGFWFPFMGFACGYLFHGEYLTGLRSMGGSTRVSALLLAAGMLGAIVLPVLISQVLADMGPKGFFQIILGLAVATTILALLNLPRSLRSHRAL
ncbi:MAG: hypothetical protein K9G43_08065 [Rhodobacteraceae bacterium]|nr:hypothetical protein [Paracoccaceae bacterium]